MFFSGGLRPGDVITQINGNEIASSSDIYRLVEEQSELKVTVKRGSDTVKLTVIAEEVNWVISMGKLWYLLCISGGDTAILCINNQTDQQASLKSRSINQSIDWLIDQK